MTVVMTNTPNVPDQTPSIGASALLTVDDIVRLKIDYDADVRLYEELPARIKFKKRRFEAALLFAPPGFNPDAPMPALVTAPNPPESSPVENAAPVFELASEPMTKEDSAGSGGKLTWIKAVSHVLETSERGLPHQEVLSKVKETKLGEHSSAGDKGFYNAIARLEKRGELIKNGGLLYSKTLVEQMRAQGQSLPDMTTEARRRAGGSATVVLEVLRDHPEGMDANQLRDEVGKKPGVPASIAKHGHYIYNILGTLIGQGAVTKGAQGTYHVAKATE